MFLEGAIMLLPIGSMPYLANLPRAPHIQPREGRMNPNTAVGLTVGLSLVAVTVAILVYLWCWHQHHRRPPRADRTARGGDSKRAEAEAEVASVPEDPVAPPPPSPSPQDRQMADVNVHRHHDHHFHRHNHFHQPQQHGHNHHHRRHHHHHHHHRHHRFHHAKRWVLHYRDPLASLDDLLRQPPQPIMEMPLAPNPADMEAPQLDQNGDHNPPDMLERVLENAHETERHRREGRRVRHHHGCTRHYHRRTGEMN